MERCTAAHVSTSLTKASTVTAGVISTTWAEDVAMSVWQGISKGIQGNSGEFKGNSGKTKEIQGKFPLKPQGKMGKRILIQIRYDKRTD